MNGLSLFRHSSGAALSIEPPSLWRAFAGYGLWAICFTVLYTGHALSCTWISSSGNENLALLPVHVSGALTGVWVFFIVWIVLLTIRSGRWVRDTRANARRRSLRFMVALTLIADASAGVAIIITGLPIILTRACV